MIVLCGSTMVNGSGSTMINGRGSTIVNWCGSTENGSACMGRHVWLDRRGLTALRRHRGSTIVDDEYGSTIEWIDNVDERLLYWCLVNVYLTARPRRGPVETVTTSSTNSALP